MPFKSIVERLVKQAEEKARDFRVKSEAADARAWTSRIGFNPPQFNQTGQIYEDFRTKNPDTRPSTFTDQFFKGFRERAEAAIAKRPDIIATPTPLPGGLATLATPPTPAPAFAPQIPQVTPQAPTESFLGLPQNTLAAQSFGAQSIPISEDRRLIAEGGLGALANPALQRARQTAFTAPFASPELQAANQTIQQQTAGGNPFVPNFTGIPGAVIAADRAVLEATRPFTAPPSRVIGGSLAETIAAPATLLGELGVPGLPRTGDPQLIGERVGEVVGPEILNPTNLIPIPILDPAVAKLVLGVFKVGQLVARPVLTRLAARAAKIAAESAEPAVKEAAQEAVEVLSREADEIVLGRETDIADKLREQIPVSRADGVDTTAAERALAAADEAPAPSARAGEPGALSVGPVTTRQVQVRRGTLDNPTLVAEPHTTTEWVDTPAGRVRVGDEVHSNSKEAGGRVTEIQVGKGTKGENEAFITVTSDAGTTSLSPSEVSIINQPTTPLREGAGAVDEVPTRQLSPEEQELKDLGVPPIEGGNPVQRLQDAIAQAKPLNAAQRAARTAELGKKAGRMSDAMREADTVDEKIAALKELKGELPSADAIEPLSNQLGPEVLEDLGGMISKHFDRFETKDFDQQDALRALRDLFLSGDIPTPHRIELLEEVFGSGALAGLPRKFNAFNEAMAVINIPRVIMANFDHSMIFRQDAITALNPRWAKETQESIAASLKGVRNAQVAEEVELAMRQTDEWVRAVDHNVEFSKLRAQSFSAAEEPFIAAAEMTWVGRQVRKIPGINLSERLAVVYLNQKRLKLYTRLAQELGPDATKKQLDDLGSLVNILTGRGKLPSSLDPYLPVLNAIFFSARMNYSRAKTFTMLPGALVDIARRKKSTSIGLTAARDFGAFLGTGLTILGALKMSGLAEVEMNCRSTDFGKAKVGSTRLDPWGGFLPMVRFACQAATGQRKTSIGDVIPLDVQNSAWRFVQSKFSPPAGFISDAVRGETVIGESVSFSDWERLMKENFIPLFIQDVIEAYREMGAGGIPLSIPGVVGVNVNSYTTSGVRVAEAIEEGIRDGLVQGDYQQNGEPFIPNTFRELDHPGDQERMAERFPELFGEEAFADRQEELPEQTQRSVRGATIGLAQDRKGESLGAVRTEASGSTASEQETRRALGDSIKDSLSDYGAVLAQSFDQFQFEGDEETFSRAGEIANQYRDISESHNERFTIADADRNEAAWAAFESEVERTFSSSDLRILEEQRIANDSETEQAWHELNAVIGDSEYYNLPQGARRESFRQRNPAVDGALWALGRVSRVMSNNGRNEAVKSYRQLYDVTISGTDVSRGSGGIPSIPSLGDSIPKVPSLR